MLGTGSPVAAIAAAAVLAVNAAVLHMAAAARRRRRSDARSPARSFARVLPHVKPTCAVRIVLPACRPPAVFWLKENVGHRHLSSLLPAISVPRSLQRCLEQARRI